MKTKTLFVTLLTVLFLALTFTTGCAEPISGDPDQPINKHPADTETQVVELSFVYDQTIVDQAASGGIGITAVTPDFPPAYVAIGGDAINPTCKDPRNTACRTDISSNCTAGVCNVSIAIPVGTWRSLWFFYAGQVQVAHMNLTSAQSTPNTTWLNNFMTVSGDTIPNTLPTHTTWPAACVRVDRPTTTTIEVNRNVNLQTKCQDALFTYELYDIGDSADNRLDDDLLVWDGTIHDGDQKVITSLWPGLVAMLRMLWNTAATPQPAYTQTFGSVTSGQSFYFAVYSHDRGQASDSGQISPIKGGVYVRTRRYDTTTHTFQTAITCGGTGYGIELVNMVNYNYLTPAADPFYVLQIQGTNTTTGCPIQGPDTRPAIFGFGT